ncbi:hypothetical protein DM02DRAFT_592835 [Periconia macrospinosa]|uniref:Putative gamma-glutamylcyclotransferase n=1 Tax=Periconia macrospinosa TaxID=97972 RepID=A0A2V1DTD5_9PLEO|nr:hypothetical protein DM02DRAFT_592835 [Periconia macrospinosa]
MSTTTTHSAFFYGTLMSPEVLQRAIQTSNPTHTATPAILPSHTRHRVKSALYPAIVPASPEHSVRGTLISNLTDADMCRLDAFEGDEYERRKVHVRVVQTSPSESDENHREGVEKEVEAETYIWIAGLDQLEDGEWDFDQFVNENQDTFLLGEGLAEG